MLLRNVNQIEAAGRDQGRRPSWGLKGWKWRPQAITMAKTKQTGIKRFFYCSVQSN